MPLISQAEAKRRLRDETGLSIATVKKAIKAMPKRLDGCRYKVSSYYVDLLIDKESQPKRATPVTNGIKRISRRRLNQIQAISEMVN